MMRGPVMILTGPEILKAVEQGDIILAPFVPGHINPNSIDVHLDSELIRYTSETLDPAIDNPTSRLVIPDQGYLLEGGGFALGSSVETLGSNKYVPIIHGKSGIARAGLFIHVSAGLVDLGSIGNLTFQLAATLPIRLRKHMPIAQVSFWRTHGETMLYQGKYQGSRGPQASQIFRDKFFTKHQEKRGDK